MNLLFFFFEKGTKFLSSSRVIRKQKRNAVIRILKHIYIYIHTHTFLHEDLEKSLIVELETSIKTNTWAPELAQASHTQIDTN